MMDRETFKKLLKQAGLTKKEFAKLVGTSYNTANAWGTNNNIPYWVESWLKNYIELQECKNGNYTEKSLEYIEYAINDLKCTLKYYECRIQNIEEVLFGKR